MNPNETRSSHPSSVQVETLVEFMERNPGLAKGFLRTQHARERSRRQWEELAVRLNSLGGTIKSYKQWTKYWADKKNATKKKVAARAAARRRTGGGVEEVVELSELEERIVALCGGEGFSTGDAHLAIEPFPESQEIQNVRTDNGSQEMADSQQRSVHSINVARRLFDSSSSSAVETSQNIFQDLQLETVAEPALSYHPSLSPPPITLSQTPSPLPMPTPSPSRRGSTQVIRRRNAASSSIRQVNISRSTPISSPSRRTRVHASREPESVLSRHTAPPLSTVAAPPSQRRTEFSTFTARFLRVEEQQLEIQRSFVQILQTCAEAVTAIGKGLEALAEAIKRD